MFRLHLSTEELENDIERMLSFICENVKEQEKTVIGVSGGLDSDVVARLSVKALGNQRVKLFIVLQDEMEAQHLHNARELAKELVTPLVEIDLRGLPVRFISALAEADPVEHFRPNGLLDPSRAKCSVRTVVLSTYQDRGYVITGTSNRTEVETGFFLPLGDALAHIKPIAHLYKSQVRQVASRLGTSDVVMNQPASAGFWEGQEDLEDLSYWIYNEGPIGQEIEFYGTAEEQVKSIYSILSTEKIDFALLGFACAATDDDVTVNSGLPREVVHKLRKLTESAFRSKLRPLGRQLDVFSLR